MRAVVRGVLAWIIGAAVAVGVGMLALSRIGYGSSTSTVQPLSSGPAAAPAAPPSASASALPAVSPSVSAAPGRPPAAPPPRPRRSSPQMSRERVFSSLAGSAIVRCARDAAYLVSWSPEQGYWVDDVRRGPAPEVTVEFENRQTEVRLRVWCDNDVPQARIGFENDND